MSQAELLKPCMETVKELWECGDDILERDANNIMKLLLTIQNLLVMHWTIY